MMKCFSFGDVYSIEIQILQRWSYTYACIYCELLEIFASSMACIVGVLLDGLHSFTERGTQISSGTEIRDHLPLDYVKKEYLLYQKRVRV